MSWIKSLLTILANVAAWVKSNQMISAGEDKQKLKTLQDVQKKTKIAIRNKSNIRSINDSIVYKRKG